MFARSSRSAASQGRAALMTLALWLLPTLPTLPAAAIVVQGGSGAEALGALAKAARAAGAEHKGPVRVHIAGDDGGKALSYGSGIYLGDSPDGETGYILTAAHIFQFNPDLGTAAAFDTAMAWAGAEAPVGEGAVIDRIYVHPCFSDVPHDGKHWDRNLFRNDLAIMTFSWKGRAKLRGTGFWQGATLIGRKEVPEGPVMDAEVAGYGDFGSNGGKLPNRSDGIQAGWTRVHQVSYRGKHCLLNWVPCAESHAERMESKTPMKELMHRFLPVTGTRAARLPGELEAAHLIQSHPEHVLPALGDSGGPLFLPTSQGPRVFGITSCMLLQSLTLEGSDSFELCLGSVWEPVAPHLDWIEAQLATGKAAAWVLEPGEPHWHRQAGPKGAAGKGAGAGDSDQCHLCAIL